MNTTGIEPTDSYHTPSGSRELQLSESVYFAGRMRFGGPDEDDILEEGSERFCYGFIEGGTDVLSNCANFDTVWELGYRVAIHHGNAYRREIQLQPPSGEPYRLDDTDTLVTLLRLRPGEERDFHRAIQEYLSPH